MSTNDVPISAETRAAATVHAEFPRNELALLGTMTGSQPARALLRAPNGRILTVTAGEKADRFTVLGIDDGRVQLARGRQTYDLKMPGN